MVAVCSHVHTYLESGDDVALNRVTLILRDIDSPKVASKRVEGHSSANNGGVVTHFRAISDCYPPTLVSG